MFKLTCSLFVLLAVSFSTYAQTDMEERAERETSSVLDSSALTKPESEALKSTQVEPQQTKVKKKKIITGKMARKNRFKKSKQKKSVATTSETTVAGGKSGRAKRKSAYSRVEADNDKAYKKYAEN